MFTASAITVESTSLQTSYEANHLLPSTTHVARQWGVKNPLDLPLSTEVVNLVLITLCDGFFQLLICLCEVNSLITPYLLWIATNTNESPKGIYH